MSDKLPRDATKFKPDYYELNTEGLSVYSWCPAPEPTVPPTQVHLHIPLATGMIVLRFKATHTLDQLIAALVKHRIDVFGPLTNENGKGEKK